ncbi:MAG: CBS domain-containing protein [Bdellovibrionales bacterium]|nr:CBS domain-containing protein [Bdellovibrionales bacterium]
MEVKLTIGEVMTTFPATVEGNESLERAKQLMLQQGYRHLPVMNQGSVVGILSERDINVAVVSSGKSSEELSVAAAFVGHPYQVSREQTLESVLHEMLLQHIGSVLVVEEGKLVGIFTTMDACRLLRERL